MKFQGRKVKGDAWSGVIFSILLASVASSIAEVVHKQVIAFDDEEVEVRVGSEFDYWPASRLGTPPIPILSTDESNFVQIDAGEHGLVWVSLSYVTTDGQRSIKKKCKVQQTYITGGKRQFSARGVGEECTEQ